MRFLAIREDLQPNPDVWSKYVHKSSVNCNGCGKTYQLWAPIEVTDEARIQSQSDSLRKELAEGCPEHEEWFHFE
jgi:hypothetical protein